MLVARQMRIEQNADSMGIDFEEGNYRDVTWGKRDRGLWQVNAGWEEGLLYIYSKASDGSAVEVYRLEEAGTRLVINIEIQTDRERMRLIRVFDRVPLL